MPGVTDDDLDPEGRVSALMAGSATSSWHGAPRPDDVFTAVTENQVEDWYPGARGVRG